MAGEDQQPVREPCWANTIYEWQATLCELIGENIGTVLPSSCQERQVKSVLGDVLPEDKGAVVGEGATHTFHVVTALSGETLTKIALPIDPHPTLANVQVHLREAGMFGRLVLDEVALSSAHVFSGLTPDGETTLGFVRSTSVQSRVRHVVLMVIGCTGVGKSTLLSMPVGRYNNFGSVYGTTRLPQSDLDIVLTDTAGLADTSSLGPHLDGDGSEVGDKRKAASKASQFALPRKLYKQPLGTSRREVAAANRRLRQPSNAKRYQGSAARRRNRW